MKKILVIDHDSFSRTMLKDNLDGFYHVFTVASGTETIDLAQQQSLDLILLDMDMPAGNGAEICSLLKETNATKYIPLILLSVVTPNCAFCVYPSMPAGTREKPQYIALKPSELVGHIKRLMERGSDHRFELCSDSLPPRYLKEFAEQVLESKLEIKWSAWSCVDKGFLDEQVLHLMRRSGCESILLGVESASERVLKRMNKIQTREDTDAVLDAVFSANINIFATLCIGFPSETLEEAMETVAYMRGLMASYGDSIETRLYRFALMCNTPILANFSQFNIASVDLSDMYLVDDDFGFRYDVTKGLNFDATRDFTFRWRSRLDIATDDSQLHLITDMNHFEAL